MKKAFFQKKYQILGLQIICVLTGIGLIGTTDLRAEGLAGSSPWQITANQIFRFTNPDAVVAAGNVVLTKVDGLTESPTQVVVIEGDWIRFDPLTKVVKVRGRVSLDSEDEKITAESAVLNLEDHTGILSNATLYFPKRELLLAGEVVEKTGELTYHFKKGWASKCGPQEGAAPPWSFGWQEADIASSGFVDFNHVTFRVNDIPILYSPYFAFSSNSDRKTGLLLPEISQSSRNGAGLLQPMFINLSPSNDLTLYGGYLSSRGVEIGAEFRYALDDYSRGTFAVNYLNDDLDDDFKSDGIYRATKNRYWIRGMVDHDFGKQIVGKLDLDMVSDQDYLQEFKEGVIGFNETQLRFQKDFKRSFESETTFARTNVGQLSRFWPDASLNAELRIISDPTEVSSASHLWTLPKIVGHGRLPVFKRMGLGQVMGPLLRETDLAWDSEYVHYWRENGVGAYRIDLNPKLVAPIRFIPYLENTISLGLRETLYSVDDNSPVKVGFDSGILSRTMQEYSFSTSTIFMRKFSGRLGGYRQLVHMVRPRIVYDYIPSKNQEQFPNLDAIDRIAAKNIVTYEVANDLDLFGVQDNGLEKTRKFAYLTIGQSFDIKEDGRDLAGVGDTREPFSPINLDLRFYPIAGLSITSDSFLDIYGRGFVQYEILSHYTGLSGSDFGLEYRYKKDEAVDQLNGNFAFGLTDYVTLEGNFLHSFEIAKTSEASLGLTYSPNCWSAKFLVTTTVEEDYRLSVMFSLAGIGQVGGFSETY